MAEYIEAEAAIELLSQPITMSMCLSTEECHHKIAQQRIDRYLIENIPAADVRPVKWIPVTERLPDFEGCVLCMRKAFVGDKLRYQDILYYEEGTFYMEFDDTPIPTEVITHWMPLPQPPKEEKIS